MLREFIFILTYKEMEVLINNLGENKYFRGQKIEKTSLHYMYIYKEDLEDIVEELKSVKPSSKKEEILLVKLIERFENRLQANARLIEMGDKYRL